MLRGGLSGVLFTGAALAFSKVLGRTGFFLSQPHTAGFRPSPVTSLPLNSSVLKCA